MEFISATYDGSPSLGTSNKASISADGRYVVFISNGPNFVVEGASSYNDIYVRDRATGITEIIPGLYKPTSAQISGNGRYIVYNLQYGVLSIYDRETGTSEPIAVATDGGAPNSYSEAAQISYDGRYVAFLSNASNLVENDTNGKPDAFILDRLTGETELVSIGANGEASSYGTDGHVVSLSDNGRYVAFASRSINLISGGTDQRVRIYVRDRLTGETSLESMAPDGVTPSDWPGYAYMGGLSANGRYITFADSATNLVVGDNNSQQDVFIRDRVTGTTEIISLTEQGTQVDKTSRLGPNSVSLNGQYVMFTSAGDLVAGADDDDGPYYKPDLYIRAVSRMQ